MNRERKTPDTCVHDADAASTHRPAMHTSHKHRVGREFIDDRTEEVDAPSESALQLTRSANPGTPVSDEEKEDDPDSAEGQICAADNQDFQMGALLEGHGGGDIILAWSKCLNDEFTEDKYVVLYGCLSLRVAAQCQQNTHPFQGLDHTRHWHFCETAYCRGCKRIEGH